MLKLFKYLKRYTFQIIIIFVVIFIQAMSDLSLPDYMSKIINEGIVGGDSASIWVNGGIMLTLSLLGGGCAVIVALLSSKVAAHFAHNVRKDLFEKVEDFSNAEFDNFSTASLITRSTNDIQQVQMVTVMALRILFSAPITGIGGIIKAVDKNFSMTWIIAAAVACLITMMVILFSINLPKFKIIQKIIDKINLIMRERLDGILVIRAFNTQKHEEDRFDNTNSELTKLNLFVNRSMSFMMPMMMLIMNVTSITIVWIGASFINDGSMMIGDMLAFIQYTMQIIMSFLMVTMMFIMLPRASVSANRINEVLKTDSIIDDDKNAVVLKGHKKSDIEFKNVSFKYPKADDYVLENINFTAKSGETTAIIGSTGSGKSTLINLIPRFYDVTEGAILIDGVDIKKATQHSLRDKIGYIPQKGVLFSGTIESNLKYGDQNATMEELKLSSEIAQATEFIETKEDKYDTHISQGGTNVSGGQKQRLSIARALVKKPDIYIFDDSFSALDFRTDANLRAALKPYTKESVVLIVAQRINTIQFADKIICLDEGRVAGVGTHKELLGNCEVYREIALSQLSKEELA